MKLVFHGAAKEVGRSCIELQTQGERYVLDAGIKFKENGFAYPEKIMNLPDIDGLLISHAHLDHTGALPLFEHYNIICPVFCTKLTYALTKILLKDSHKIARIKHLHPAYDNVDLEKLEKGVRFVKYDKEYKHRKIKFIFRNAGHVPGSAMILIEAEGKKILYTGDIKLKSTELMKGAFTDYQDIDAMIIESTYGSRELPERAELKKRFLNRIEDVIQRGGSVLIPVYGLGRAQEIMMVLGERKFKVPIYMDGMCKKVTNRIISTPDPYINNPQRLDELFNHNVIHISSERHRQQALKRQGIFITTSGMLQGGPVLSYLSELWHDPRNAVFLTGYQCKRTNGWHLVNEGYIYLEGWRTYVKCEIEKYEFSGHADQTDLKEIIKRVHPVKLIFQHGDPESIDAMAKWASTETKSKVYTPGLGDEIEL